MGAFPHIDPNQLWPALQQILIGSAVVTTVINITWFVISSGVNAVARRLRLRVKQHLFVLKEGVTREEYANLSRDISAFYCLVVRYGTDDYISKMASDSERFEGRQLLKVHPISATFDQDDQVKFSLTLPIHKTMGTQFKCFAEARSVEHVPAVIATLEKCEHASDVKQSDSYKRERVFFLLDQFAVAETIHPGIRNNYIFPE
jgi:hypothetical protein